MRTADQRGGRAALCHHSVPFLVLAFRFSVCSRCLTFSLRTSASRISGRRSIAFFSSSVLQSPRRAVLTDELTRKGHARLSGGRTDKKEDG